MTKQINLVEFTDPLSTGAVEDGNLSISVTASASYNGSGQIIVEGVVANILDKPTANGTIYSSSIMTDAIDFCHKNHLFTSRLLHCSADEHPRDIITGDYSIEVVPTSASHTITNAYIKSYKGYNLLLIDIIILDTDLGKNLAGLIKSSGGLGTSIRGYSVDNTITGDIVEYRFRGCDFVSDPASKTYCLFDTSNLNINKLSTNLEGCNPSSKIFYKLPHQDRARLESRKVNSLNNRKANNMKSITKQTKAISNRVETDVLKRKLTIAEKDGQLTRDVLEATVLEFHGQMSKVKGLESKGYRKSIRLLESLQARLSSVQKRKTFESRLKVKAQKRKLVETNRNFRKNKLESIVAKFVVRSSAK